MSDDLCLYEVTDGVALLTLNRPQRNNAWNAALGTAYFDRLAQADADGKRARADRADKTSADKGGDKATDKSTDKPRTKDSGSVVAEEWAV